MRLADVQPGDTIEADVRGRRFEAKVRSLDDTLIDGRPILVEPLSSNVTFFHLAAANVVRRIDPPPNHRRPDSEGNGR